MLNRAKIIIVVIIIIVMYFNVGYIFAHNISYVGNPQTVLQKFLSINGAVSSLKPSDMAGFMMAQTLWPIILFASLFGWFIVGVVWIYNLCLQFIFLVLQFAFQGGLAKLLGLV